jgi:MoxR-like ATPase
MGRSIVGQRTPLDQLVIVLLCGGHALIEGVPGLAKTLAVKTLALVGRLDFRRVQCTPDLMPADILGTTGRYSRICCWWTKLIARRRARSRRCWKRWKNVR